MFFPKSHYKNLCASRWMSTQLTAQLSCVFLEVDSEQYLRILRLNIFLSAGMEQMKNGSWARTSRRPVAHSSRQEVVNRLNLWSTGRFDFSLSELREPITANSSPGGNLPLTQPALFNQIVCASKKVHCQILEKYYPDCKENFTHVTCDNGSAWARLLKTTSLPASLPSRRQLWPL